MTPSRTRPTGIAFLAVAFIWIGCVGLLVMPFLASAGGLAQFWPSTFELMFHVMHLPKAVNYSLLTIWVLLYPVYALMGVGFWKLRNWARRLALGLFTFFGILALVVTPFFARPVSLAVAIVIGLTAPFAWLIWYLLRPRVRYAFGAWPADSAYPPGLSRIGKTGVVLSVLACFAVYVITLSMAIECMLQQSSVYKMTLQQAQNSPCVNALMGSPLKPGWMISGDEQSSDTDGSADLSIPVSGPKGKGSLEVEAKKQKGAWRINSLNLLHGAQTTKIVPALPDAPCR